MDILTNNLARYYVATSAWSDVRDNNNKHRRLSTRTSPHCAPRLTHSSALKIHLACRLRPRHREDAYIVIRYISPAPPIITCNTPCSTIRRLIVWRVKMACIRRTVEVRITAVSLLFSYNTNIFEIMSISYACDMVMQGSSRITDISFRNLNIKYYHY